MLQYKARVRKILDGKTYVLDIDLGLEGLWLKDKVVRLDGIKCPSARGKDKCEAGLKVRDFAIDRIHGTEVIIDVEDVKKLEVKLYAKDHLDEEGNQIYVDFASLLVDKEMAEEV